MACLSFELVFGRRLTRGLNSCAKIAVLLVKRGTHVIQVVSRPMHGLRLESVTDPDCRIFRREAHRK